MSAKTKTDVLLDENQKLVCFGEPAYYEYVDRCDPSMLYFERFKMCLYGDIGGRKKPRITAANGTSVDATTVLSQALMFVKLKAIARLEHAGLLVDPIDIRWVLTVPAIWTPAAKSVMKEAARQAGMCSRPDQLVFALEPEAASLMIRTDLSAYVNSPATVSCKAAQILSHVGAVMAVCDAGGGTVDVVVHKIVDPATKAVIELAPPGKLFESAQIQPTLVGS